VKNASPHSYSSLNYDKETKSSMSEIALVLRKNVRFSLLFFLNYLKKVLGICTFEVPKTTCHLNIITLSFYQEDASMREISRAYSVNGHRPISDTYSGGERITS